jgi:hypothetical protein
LALVRATSDNGMAVTAACRQLELMRQTVAEETGGPQRHAPGLVVRADHHAARAADAD